jgi:hypothetical protein
MAQLLFQTELGTDPIFSFFWYRLKRPKKVFLKGIEELRKEEINPIRVDKVNPLGRIFLISRLTKIQVQYFCV